MWWSLAPLAVFLVASAVALAHDCSGPQDCVQATQGSNAGLAAIVGGAAGLVGGLRPGSRLAPPRLVPPAQLPTRGVLEPAPAPTPSVPAAPAPTLPAPAPRSELPRGRWDSELRSDVGEGEARARHCRELKQELDGWRQVLDAAERELAANQAKLQRDRAISPAQRLPQAIDDTAREIAELEDQSRELRQEALFAALEQVTQFADLALSPSKLARKTTVPGRLRGQLANLGEILRKDLARLGVKKRWTGPLADVRLDLRPVRPYAKEVLGRRGLGGLEDRLQKLDDTLEGVAAAEWFEDALKSGLAGKAERLSRDDWTKILEGVVTVGGIAPGPTGYVFNAFDAGWTVASLARASWQNRTALSRLRQGLEGMRSGLQKAEEWRKELEYRVEQSSERLNELRTRVERIRGQLAALGCE